MKHVRVISKDTVGSADAFQEAVCAVNQILADFLRALGGASPLVSYLEEKCDLPGRDDTTATG